LYGFHCGVAEASILLGYDTSISNWLQNRGLIFMCQNVPKKFYLDVEKMHGNKPGDKKRKKRGGTTFGGNSSVKLKITTLWLCDVHLYLLIWW
jgi:hypothetical protein